MGMRYVHYDDSNNTNRRNHVEEFDGRSTKEIRELLYENRSSLVNVCMNLTSDFNKSSVIRSNNAFLAKEVIIVGKKRFDRRGCVGAHQIENIIHADTLKETVDYLHNDGYRIYAVDNIPEFSPKAIYDVELPEKTAFVYGEEQKGLSQEAISMCDDMVYIPQYGSVRSINVAQAASIMMSEYCRRYRSW